MSKIALEEVVEDERLDHNPSQDEDAYKTVQILHFLLSAFIANKAAAENGHGVGAHYH